VDQIAGVVQLRVTPKTRNPFTTKTLSIFGVTWKWHFLNHAVLMVGHDADAEPSGLHGAPHHDGLELREREADGVGPATDDHDRGSRDVLTYTSRFRENFQGKNADSYNHLVYLEVELDQKRLVSILEE